MLGRALSLAAAGLVGCLVATPGWAQNLDAGKSPAQIFNGSCAACHKSARGLLRTVPPSSLSGFLRQHYTTGSDMAQMLAGYLVANGASAAEPRSGGKRGRQDVGKQDSGNLRPDAPIGSAASDERAREQTERKPPRGAAGPAGAQPDEAVQAEGRKPRHRRHEVAPVEGAPAEAVGNEPPANTRKQKLSRKKKGEPAKDETKTEPQAEPKSESKGESKSEPAAPAPAEAAGKVEPKPPVKPAAPVLNEKAIDAAVPMPEPANVPPPTAADVKSEAPRSEAPKSEASKSEAPKSEIIKPEATRPAAPAASEKAATDTPASEKPAADPEAKPAAPQQ